MVVFGLAGGYALSSTGPSSVDGSVRMKIGKRPVEHGNAPVVVRQGVGMKVGRPPVEETGLVRQDSASETTGVSMKVGRPPAQHEPAVPSEVMPAPQATMKVGKRPVDEPAVSSDVMPAPQATMKVSKRPVDEPEPLDLDAPVVEPPVVELPVAELPVAELPVAEALAPDVPMVRIGAKDVGAMPEGIEKGEDLLAMLDDGYRYDRANKLNPYRPLTAQMETSIIPPPPTPPVVDDDGQGSIVVVPPSQQPEEMHIPTPLEKYPLNALELVAIMRTKTKAMGLIEIPDGRKGFIIKKGTFIGNEGGKVHEIDLKNNEVIVLVKETDIMTGDVTMVRQQIRLQKTAGDF